MFLMRFIVMPKRSVEQIRWKKAHPAVAQEIEDHLTDRKTPTLPQEIPKALPKKRHCCRWVTLYPSVRR